MRREITVRDQKIIYELTRKRVKNINIRVNRNGEIHVSAAESVPAEDIDDVLEKRSDFVLDAVRRVVNRSEISGVSGYRDGAVVHYLGAKYTVCVLSGGKGVTGIRGDRLYVCAENNPECIEKEIKRWYDAMIPFVFGDTERSAALRFAGIISFRPEYRYRYMKSLWGSCCTAKRRITINKNLLKYERSLIEFVFCHEYTHFIYPDHSPGFYRLLSSVLPDHAKLRKRLNEVSELY